MIVHPTILSHLQLESKADTSPGGQTTLEGWSLDITAVPEPVNWALVIFSVGVFGAIATRSFLRTFRSLYMDVSLKRSIHN